MKFKTIMKSAIAVVTVIMLPAGCRPAPPDPATMREMKITVLVDNLGDLSYNDGIVREMRQAGERYRESGALDLSVNVFEMQTGTGNEKTELESAFGADSELIIIANQIGLPILEPAAAYYPEKRFILFDMEATGPNIYSALFKPNEAAYLCGALAAKMSGAGMIGIVIGMEIPALHDFCVGYILGAQAVDSDCKVMVSAVGNFYDADMGYEAAAKQFERGADVCFSAAGGAGLGCIKAASDFGRFAIGVDIDQTEQVEAELKNVILTSCLKNFDVLVAAMLDNYVAGTIKFGESGRYGLREGAVGIARNQYYTRMVPQNIRDEIDALEAKVSVGEAGVRSAFEMTQAEIDELFKSVRP